jgi:hypothetical protein
VKGVVEKLFTLYNEGKIRPCCFSSSFHYKYQDKPFGSVQNRSPDHLLTNITCSPNKLPNSTRGVKQQHPLIHYITCK